MTLTAREFMRQFELHILPHRFVRIRHYGASKIWESTVISQRQIHGDVRTKVCKVAVGHVIFSMFGLFHEIFNTVYSRDGHMGIDFGGA